MRIVGLAAYGLLAGCPSAHEPRQLQLEGADVVSVSELGPVPAPRTVVEGTDVELQWSAEPSTVAVVSDGQVRAVGPGEATVTGEWTGQSVSWTLVVTTPVAVRFDDTVDTLRVGQSSAVTVVVDGSQGPVVWSSSSADVATVTADGLVTARAPGTTYVSAMVGGAEAMMELLVIP